MAWLTNVLVAFLITYNRFFFPSSLFCSSNFSDDLLGQLSVARNPVRDRGRLTRANILGQESNVRAVRHSLRADDGPRVLELRQEGRDQRDEGERRQADRSYRWRERRLRAKAAVAGRSLCEGV